MTKPEVAREIKRRGLSVLSYSALMALPKGALLEILRTGVGS